MELRHLRYFVGVVEAGTFTLAAERLHTVQPSLSRQIRDLENHVGTPLFERSSRRVQLTQAGHVFLDEVRLVLAQANRAVERAREAARAQAGRLTLGFVPGVEVEHLVQIMDSLHGELEDIELAMQSRSSPALIAALQERRLDAAFIRPSEQANGLQLCTVRRERLIVAMPATHRLAASRRLDIAQLVDDRLISVTHEHAPVLYEAIQAYAARHDVTLLWTYESENLQLALSLISTVGAVCLLPEHSARLFPSGVVGVPLEKDAPIVELALAWHPQNESEVLARFLCAFRNGMRDASQPSAAWIVE
ncbi:LysR substrate-binding domain-containing protein [Caballeronia sp. LjRoot34]|uniref:LysR substrate-binding domain-containing protein n=1 Tax=Caballeronia sp. LjRoot34 TaxID=3342325 RepID=UPI003ECF72B7